MIPEITFNASTSILRFQSVPDLRRYLKKILDGNLREMDKMNDAVALAMRDDRYDSENPSIKGWVKRGNIFINKEDPDRATLDLLFHLSREVKPRIAQVSEALKAVEKLDSMGIDEDASLILYVRFGIPERVIVIKTDEPKPGEKFELQESYVTR
ncbi:MAG: hypothetical protein ACLQEQ_09710 [Nitrososphaerales archaeon]